MDRKTQNSKEMFRLIETFQDLLMQMLVYHISVCGVLIKLIRAIECYTYVFISCFEIIIIVAFNNVLGFLFENRQYSQCIYVTLAVL